MNYDELKEAAEAANTSTLAGISAWGKACSPQTILALLAEREKLLKVVEAARRYREFISELQDTIISEEEYARLYSLRDALKELGK